MNELTFCLITSLKITAIYICCQPGMIFFKVRQELGLLLYSIGFEFLAKPLYDCLPCMASIWGFAFWMADGWNHNLFSVVFITCGILAIIQYFIPERLADE